jgi:hypothetical protein
MIGGCNCAGCLSSYVANGPDGTVYHESQVGATGSYDGFINWPQFLTDGDTIVADRVWFAAGFAGIVQEKFFGGVGGPIFPRGSYFLKYCGGAFSTGYEFNPLWFVDSDNTNQSVHIAWMPIASEDQAQFSYGILLGDGQGHVRTLFGFAFPFTPASANSKPVATRNAACLLKPFYHAGGQLTLTFPGGGSWTFPKMSPGDDWPRWQLYRAKPLLFPGTVISKRPGVAGDSTRYDLTFRVYSLSRGRWWANTQIVGPTITSVDQPAASIWWNPHEEEVITRYIHSNTSANVVRFNFDDQSGGATGMPGTAGSEVPACSWDLTPHLRIIEVANSSHQAAPPRRRVTIKILNTGRGPTTIPLRFTFENTANVTWDSAVLDFTAARLGGSDNPNNYAAVSLTSQDPIFPDGSLSSGLIFRSGTFAVPGGASFSGPVEIRFTITNGPVNHGTHSFIVQLGAL